MLPASLFVNAWHRLPEAMKEVLRQEDILPLPHNAELFERMHPIYEDDWVDAALDLTPQDMRQDQERIFRKSLLVLKRASIDTPPVSNFTAFQQEVLIRQTSQIADHFNAQHKEMSDIQQALGKWRHWTPRLTSTFSHISQRQLEIQLTDRWISKILALLLP